MRCPTPICPSLRLVAANPVIVPDRELEEEKIDEPQARPSAARSAGGRLARKTSGLVPVVMNGTPLTPEASALRACTSGRRRSAFPAEGGLHTPTGMLID
jgi:hypothetical protein